MVLTGTDSGFRSPGHQLGAGQRNFGLAMADYGFAVCSLT